jgi:hypothetical protein
LAGKRTLAADTMDDDNAQIADIGHATIACA